MISRYRIAATTYLPHLVVFGLFALWCAAFSFTPGGATVEWIVFAMAEIVYQIVAPDLSYFKTMVNLQDLKKRSEEAWAARRLAGNALIGNHASTYGNLLNMEENVRTHVKGQPQEMRNGLVDAVQRLEKVVRVYLQVARKYAGLHRVVNGHDIGGTTAADLRAQVAKLQDRQERANKPVPTEIPDPEEVVEVSTDPVGRVHQTRRLPKMPRTPKPPTTPMLVVPEEVLAIERKRLIMLEGRLKKMAACEDQLPVVEAQLESLKDIATAIRDQIMAPVGPTRVRVAELDELMASAQTDTGAEDIADLLAETESIEAEAATIEEILNGK